MLKTTDSNTNKETGGQDTRSGTEKRCSHNLQSGSKPILASGLFKWQAAFLFRAKKKKYKAGGIIRARVFN